MESQTGTLNLTNLVNPREGTYFYCLLVVAVIIWLLVALSLVGLFVVAALALVGWFTHGLLVARLRSESVRITEAQYPALYASFKEVCERLQLAEMPELYLLQSGGMLNAFATRHAGRNFVVLYSSFVEVLGPSSPMMKFLMGHEIGHIQRKHLTKHLYLVPGSLIPLLAEAYHRACEATCDRYGAYASNDLNSSMLALTVLASGREAANIDTQQFAEQHLTTRGFFVSWHELIVSYPTLSQRVAQILGFHNEKYAKRVGRSAVAYPFAFLFSAKTLILAYFAVVGISVLVSLGSKGAKAAEAAAQAQADKEENAFTPIPPVRKSEPVKPGE